MAVELDPRVFAYRDDISAISLKGQVQSARFVEPQPMQVKLPLLDLLAAPESNALASQLLFGEVFDVYHVSENLAWGQNRADGYVGYVVRSGLGEVTKTNHRITATLAHIYPEPHFKGVPTSSLTYGADVSVSGKTGGFYKTTGGYISEHHLQSRTDDFVSEAARFVGTPYLWGGRSPMGIDCSALVQLALMAIGTSCPRDSDMQMENLGDTVSGAYVRGDLLFWKGHVGIMFDEATLLHANTHMMCVSLEPISNALARITETDGPILAHKRL